MPHHHEGALKVLGCEDTREAVAAAVAKWSAGDLEDAFAAAALPTGMVRTRAEWQAHPQGLAVAALPLLEIVKIGEAPPEPAGAGPRALSGIRVLDLTRVIAGPICGRTLAGYGADVLNVLVEAPAEPAGLGDRHRAWASSRRRSTCGRPPTPTGCARSSATATSSASPTGRARSPVSDSGPKSWRGFAQGIVYVTLSAFSHAGPWRERRGFETIIQSVTGMAHEQGLGAAGGDKPQHLPAQVVDHGTGYLAAFGAQVALARRAREGGSYLVRVSLAQTGRWVDGLGRVDGRRTPDLTLDAVQDLMTDMDTPYGRLRHVVPAARLSETPAFWSRPTVPLGTHPAAWPA